MTSSILPIHSSISYPLRNNSHVVKTMISGLEFYNELFLRCSNAQRSIWCGVSFAEWDFKFPNGKYWWQVFQAIHAKNNNIKIRILFWRNLDRRWSEHTCIKGSDSDLDDYIARHKLCKSMEIKWDESPTKSHCHHQKYFVIDAENVDAVTNTFCFIGGMILSDSCYRELIHDTVIELQGDCCIDVIANFQLRWNNANINVYGDSNKYQKCLQFCAKYHTKIMDFGVKNIDNNSGNKYKNFFTNMLSKSSNNNNSNESTTETPNETQTNQNTDDNGTDNNSNDNPSANGNAWQTAVQICWTCYPGLYPGISKEFGECGIHYQYTKQFENAKNTIYIESQHPGEYHLLNILRQKLEANPDLKVLYVVPVYMMHPIKKAKQQSVEYHIQYEKHNDNDNDNDNDNAATNSNNAIPEPPRYHPMFRMLSSLAKFDNFCYSGMYLNKDAIYVHSKLCIVDGQWLTIGSANFVDISFISDHTEINACVFDRHESMSLLRKLAAKHCCTKSAANMSENENNAHSQFFEDEFVDDTQLITHMMSLSKSNADRYYESGNMEHMNGRLFKLHPALYATSQMKAFNPRANLLSF